MESSSSTIEFLSSFLHVGEGLLKTFYQKKAILIADGAVAELYGEPLANRLDCPMIVLPPLKKKTKQMQEFVENALFRLGADRETTLLALGGGETTDLVGFVASIYLRGVPLILIPTTLLAMVDAAIGGKTAIDTPFGKNLLGTIYHPKAIIADLDTLKTLPEKEMQNGISEILKIGLVFDRSIWESRSMIDAMKAKIAIITQDPTELGLRRILNFGHTIGHGLEKCAQYEISHGQAVALGCLAEAHLSMHLGFLSAEDFEHIQISFPHQLPIGYTREKLFEAMLHDKKKKDGKLRFVLIDKIGHALPFDGAYCRHVTEKELEATLDFMEKNNG